MSEAKQRWLTHAAVTAARSKVVVKGATVLVLGGAALLGHQKALESQEPTVYADRLAQGLPTFCSGATDRTMPVGEQFSRAECDAIDRMTAITYGEGILACISADKLDQNSFDAMTLFAIHVGIKGACESRAARLIRARDRAAGCKAISTGPDGKPAWSFAGGVYVRGLQNRRKIEEGLCAKVAS